jgi:hypothetical protein
MSAPGTEEITIAALDARMRWTEEERVLAWRIEGLMRAGYDRHSAIDLAERPGVDLHLAQKLLAGGCPVRTAVRILL